MMLLKQFEGHRALIAQFLKFGIIGFFSFLVDLAFFHIGFNILGLGHYASAFLSFPFAATFGWFGNRLFTFSGQNAGSPHAQWIRFVTVSAFGLILNRGTYSALTATVPLVYAYPVLGLLAGTAAGMFFNFFFVKKIVFR